MNYWSETSLGGARPHPVLEWSHNNIHQLQNDSSLMNTEVTDNLHWLTINAIHKYFSLLWVAQC